MSSSTNVAIDASGRLVVPKNIRERAGFRPGMALEIRYRDGRVEIEPAPRQVRLIQKGKVCVAVPLESSEPLTSEIVQRTQEEIRNRHADG